MKPALLYFATISEAVLSSTAYVSFRRQSFTKPVVVLHRMWRSLHFVDTFSIVVSFFICHARMLCYATLVRFRVLLTSSYWNSFEGQKFIMLTEILPSAQCMSRPWKSLSRNGSNMVFLTLRMNRSTSEERSSQHAISSAIRSWPTYAQASGWTVAWGWTWTVEPIESKLHVCHVGGCVRAEYRWEVKCVLESWNHLCVTVTFLLQSCIGASVLWSRFTRIRWPSAAVRAAKVWILRNVHWKKCWWM